MGSSRVHVVSEAEIAPEVWDAVAPDRQQSPKLRHGWARAWAAAYSRGGALRVLALGPLDRPDALLPLTVAPEGLHRHGFIANDDGGLPVLYRDPSVLPDLAAALIRLRVPVDLGYYPVDDPFLPALARAARGRAKVMLKPQEIPAAPWLDLDPSWAEPLDHLRRNLRQSIRRNSRRLDELGAVTVDYLTPAEDEVDALLDVAVEVEAKSWKSRTGTALVQDTRQQTMFRLYARDAARAGRLHIALLRLDGAPLAISLGEIRANIYWAYKIGYDEAYAKVGPGVLLHYNLTAHLAAQGIERIEFQGQLVEYKRNWTDRAVATTAVRIYPYAPRGLAAMACDAVGQGRKRFKARREAAAREAKADRIPIGATPRAAG